MIWMEFGYGVKAWWTTGFISTGILYVEYEIFVSSQQLKLTVQRSVEKLNGLFPHLENSRIR